jgi:predicted nucleic acid-binding protein
VAAELPGPNPPRPDGARTVATWASALVLPLGIAAACIPLRAHVAAADVALLLAVVILVAATLGGRITGAVAALDAAVAFDLFFTKPYYSLRINRAEDLETALLMLIVGVAIGEIVTRGRRDRHAAHVSRSNLERVSRFTELAAGGERPGRLIRVARRELIELLALDDAEFERPPFFDALPRLNHSGLSIPPTLATDGHAAARRASQIELPIWAEGLEVGRFVLTLTDEATGLEFAPQARTSALALADQLGVVLLAHDR